MSGPWRGVEGTMSKDHHPALAREELVQLLCASTITVIFVYVPVL